jgi:phytoene desaturase
MSTSVTISQGVDSIPDQRDRRPHAVVIGSGFGGLAAAIRLSADGYRVTVLEARAQPGGRAGQIREAGYTFDTGPTLITAPELLHDLWSLAGRRLEEYVTIRPLEPFYQIRFQDGEYFDYWGDQHRLEAEIGRYSQRDVLGYRRFLEASGTVYRRAFAELGREPFDRFISFLRVVPNLVRLGGMRSVYSYVAQYITDPYLRTVFSFHPLFIGGNPFRASAIYSIVPYLERRGGVHFAMGGMHALVQAMVRLIEELGGTIQLGSRVSCIASESRRVTGVRLANGETVSAEIVVANSDAAHTLLDTLQPDDRSRIWSWRWRSARYSMSCFLLYLGVRKQFPNLQHHTIVMPRDYRGVVTQIFEGDDLPEDLAIYIHTPTRTDPDLAPAGCESMYVLVPVPNLRANIDWNRSAPLLRERVLEFLETEVGLAGLRSSIEVERQFTPVDFRDELGSWLGAAFSLEPTLSQSAYFRPPNRSREVAGLYFVGAGTHPGAGVPGVLLSAEIASRQIREDARVLGTQSHASLRHRTT